MSKSLKHMQDDYCAVSDLYAGRCGIARDRDWSILKIQEELGELVQVHLRLSGRARDKGEDEALLHQSLADEASDVLGMLLIYCSENNIDIEEAAERKWFKYLKEQADG